MGPAGALQINGRRHDVDANHGARTSRRRLGASGSCGCAGKPWTTRVSDCGGEREKRRGVPVGRRGNDVEKSDGGSTDQRILVHERNFRGSEERRYRLCRALDAKVAALAGEATPILETPRTASFMAVNDTVDRVDGTGGWRGLRAVEESFAAYRRICKGLNEALAAWQELKRKDAAALSTLLGKSKLISRKLPNVPDLAGDAACVKLIRSSHEDLRAVQKHIKPTALVGTGAAPTLRLKPAGVARDRASIPPVYGFGVHVLDKLCGRRQRDRWRKVWRAESFATPRFTSES